MNDETELSGFVDVGGRRLYVACAGRGSPTLILEAGGGYASATWDPVWPQLAEITRVCRYDRANLGRSDTAAKPRTGWDGVDDLRSLLDKLNLSGPYILAGHSLGAHLVRLFTERHRRTVTGIILVDPPHPDTRQQVAPLLPVETEADSDYLKKYRTNVTQPHLLVTEEGFALATLLQQVRDTVPLGDLPVLLLASEHPLKEVASQLPEGLAEKIEAVISQGHRDLASLSTNCTYRTVEQSGHFIHRDRPDVFVRSVRQFVDNLRHAGA